MHDAKDCDARASRAAARATLKVVDPPQLEDDYELLFDGTSKTDWTAGRSRSSSCSRQDGSLVSYGGLGMLWYAKQEFGDFSLKMSWKVEDGTDNSGVFVRFPNTGKVHNTAIDQGHEIQIHEGANTSEPQKTGSVYNFKREERRSSNPIGEWNDYEIRAKGLTSRCCSTARWSTRSPAPPRGRRRPATSASRTTTRTRRSTSATCGSRRSRSIAPTTTAVLDPAQPGASGFYTGPVSVTLAATDTTGIRRRRHRVPAQRRRVDALQRAVRVADDGRHTLEYRSTDRDGNVEETKSVAIAIDATAPVTTATLDRRRQPGDPTAGR